LKATATTLTADVDARGKSPVAVFNDLIKARLTFLVVLTTLVGFYLGSPTPVDYALMLHAVLGTAVVASGAAALNQVLEREHDAKMRRTANRPLPGGHMTTNTALLIGVALSVVGLAWLLFAVNPLTALLGAITHASYVFIYTPLKRVTVLNTLVGAVPGALPPLMGWAAATNSLSAPGWSLFGILFFWQLPHFMAIAWLYRDEYSGAGFRMLSGVDPEGRRTAASAIRNTIALLVISLFPYLLGLVGAKYVLGAIALGLAFLVMAVRFARHLTPVTARALFFASILYLPLLLGLLVADKTTKKLTTPNRVSVSSGLPASGG
jgi:protoheme IX farnesyltransferase